MSFTFWAVKKVAVMRRESIRNYVDLTLGRLDEQRGHPTAPRLKFSAMGELAYLLFECRQVGRLLLEHCIRRAERCEVDVQDARVGAPGTRRLTHNFCRLLSTSPVLPGTV